MKYLAVHLGILIFLAASAIPGYGEEQAMNAQSLFEQKCSQCHNIDRPKSKKKNADGWKTTVMRMKNVNGCPISDKEAELIINYLTENYGT